MANNHSSNGNSRLEALRQREAALRAAIATERVKEQKRREKELDRLFSLVGEICVRDGEESPEYKAMLIRVMQGATISDANRAFLARMGWL
jgi:hypothetical protein